MGRKKKVQTTESVVQKEYFEYIVKAGDGIKKIARNLNKDWQEIANDNNLQEPYELYINQKLIIK